MNFFTEKVKDYKDECFGFRHSTENENGKLYDLDSQCLRQALHHKFVIDVTYSYQVLHADCTHP